MFLWQTVLGEDQYVLTRLNKLYDSMPSSESLVHPLFSSPPTTLKGNFMLSLSLCTCRRKALKKGSANLLLKTCVAPCETIKYVVQVPT